MAIVGLRFDGWRLAGIRVHASYARRIRLPTVAAVRPSLLVLRTSYFVLPSVDADQLHLEDERGAGWNLVAVAGRAVRLLGRDDKPAQATNFHAGDPDFPSADDGAVPDQRRKRRLADIRLEQFALAVGLRGIVQPEGVVNGNAAPDPGLGAVAGAEVGDLHPEIRRIERAVATGRGSDRKHDREEGCGQ